MLSYLPKSEVPASPNHITCIPILHWDVKARISQGHLTMELADVVLTFKGFSNPDALLGLLPLMHGTHSLNHLAQISRVPLNEIWKLVELLRENRFVSFTENYREVIEKDQFLKICRTIFGHWKQRLFSHSFWRLLSAGKASNNQFIGWILENYHFILRIHSRLAYATACCKNHQVRTHLALHYSEEYDHSSFFEKALRNSGFTVAELEAMRPLPSTIAVINYMRECARADTLQYTLCSGFLESTGDDRIKGHQFFENLINHYSPTKPDVVSPLADHLRLDEAYGHDKNWEKNIACFGVITTERATAALRAGFLFLETLELWATDMARYYKHVSPKNRPFPSRYLHKQ